MRTHLYSALGTLKLGMDILLDKENVKLDRMFGHGGLFKTKDVGQKFMAAAINTPVSLMETAGEGGAWGIALLASYMLAKSENEHLPISLTTKYSHKVNHTHLSRQTRTLKDLTNLLYVTRTVCLSKKRQLNI